MGFIAQPLYQEIFHASNSIQPLCISHYNPIALILDERFTKEDAAVVIEHVIEEIDIDQDGKLSYLEFEHVISKAPDFTNLFRITI